MPILHERKDHWSVTSYSRSRGRFYEWQFSTDGDDLRQRLRLKDEDKLGGLFSIMLNRGLLYCDSGGAPPRSEAQISNTDWEFFRTRYADALTRITIDELDMLLKLTSREKSLLARHCKKLHAPNPSPATEDFPLTPWAFRKKFALSRGETVHRYPIYRANCEALLFEQCRTGKVRFVSYQASDRTVLVERLDSCGRQRVPASLIVRFLIQFLIELNSTKPRPLEDLVPILVDCLQRINHPFTGR